MSVLKDLLALRRLNLKVNDIRQEQKTCIYACTLNGIYFENALF